ncbi:hypothetical protein LTR28_006382, partial [Elasticomyces elasticus]
MLIYAVNRIRPSLFPFHPIASQTRKQLTSESATREGKQHYFAPVIREPSPPRQRG